MKSGTRNDFEVFLRVLPRLTCETGIGADRVFGICGVVVDNLKRREKLQVSFVGSSHFCFAYELLSKST